MARKKKILIIDDEIDLVDLVKLRLESENYYVEPLYTSTRALEIAKREKPDLILVDIMMPDKDGFQVCKELKSDKDTCRIPVILFTAKPEEKEHVRRDYESAGADDYVMKPFDPVDLFTKIRFLLESKR